MHGNMFTTHTEVKHPRTYAYQGRTRRPADMKVLYRGGRGFRPGTHMKLRFILFISTLSDQNQALSAIGSR